MKRLVYILFLLCSFANVFSQVDDSLIHSSGPDSLGIYKIAEQMPEYPGGTSELMKYLQENIDYPKPSLLRNQQGKVFTNFVIDEKGYATNVQVIKSSGFELIDLEAIRVVKCMPKWKPGMKNGKPVKVYFNMPINFKLNGSSLEKSVITNKEYSDFYYNLGVKYSESKKYELAIENFTNCLKYNPEDIDALYNRGTMFLKINLTEKACIDWKKIKELGKNDADELLKKYCNN